MSASPRSLRRIPRRSRALRPHSWAYLTPRTPHRKRSYARGILVFLVLGTALGLLPTIPSAVGLPVSGSGTGVALPTALLDVILLAALALMPLLNGLGVLVARLTDAQARP